MASQPIKVLRLVTDNGVFFTRDTDRMKFFANKWVKSIEEVNMLEQEFESLPITEEAKQFFSGQIIGSRAV